MQETIIDKYVAAKLQIGLLEEELKLAKQQAALLEEAVIEWMSDNNTLQIRTPAGLVSYAPQTWVSTKNADQLSEALRANPDFQLFDGVQKYSFDSRSLSARYREAVKTGTPIPQQILDNLNVVEQPKTKFTPTKEAQ